MQDVGSEAAALLPPAQQAPGLAVSLWDLLPHPSLSMLPVQALARRPEGLGPAPVHSPVELHPAGPLEVIGLCCPGLYHLRSLSVRG